VSSEARARDPVLTVISNTEEGDRYMLPLSERAITQLTEVITGWRRTRDFPDQQELLSLSPINVAVGPSRSRASHGATNAGGRAALVRNTARNGAAMTGNVGQR
jgi:hypothetical protein